MNRLPRTVVTDLIVLSVLSLLGIAGYETSFGDLNFLVAAVAGIVVGTLAAVVGSLLRLGVLTTVLLGLAAYFVLGTPFTMPALALFGVLPSLASLTGLALGAVYGWADIVTIGTPVEAPYYIAACRTSRPGSSRSSAPCSHPLAAAAPHRAAVERAAHRPGAALPVGHPARHRRGRTSPACAASRSRPSRSSGSPGVAAPTSRRAATAPGACARRSCAARRSSSPGPSRSGPSAGLAIAPVAPDRFVLRDEIVPPFDPLEFPSPLAGFRNYTKDLAETAAVHRDRARARRRDAARRDGLVHGPTVERGRPRAGRCRRRRTRSSARRCPAPELATLGSSRDVEISVDGYDDVWLPTVGYGSSLQLIDEASAARGGDLRYNAAAGTAVLTSGIDEGASYRLEARIQQEPDTERAHRHPGRVARAHARREPARRRRGEGRGVRGRGDEPRSSSCATSSGA